MGMAIICFGIRNLEMAIDNTWGVCMKCVSVLLFSLDREAFNTQLSRTGQIDRI